MPLNALVIVTPIMLMILKPVNCCFNVCINRNVGFLFRMSPLLTNIVINNAERFIIFTKVRVDLTPVVVGGVNALNCSVVKPIGYITAVTYTNVYFNAFLGTGGTRGGTDINSTFVSTFVNVARPTLCNINFHFGGPLVNTIINNTITNNFITTTNNGTISCTVPSVVSLPTCANAVPIVLANLTVTFIMSTVISCTINLSRRVTGSRHALTTRGGGIGLNGQGWHSDQVGGSRGRNVIVRGKFPGGFL